MCAQGEMQRAFQVYYATGAVQKDVFMVPLFSIQRVNEKEYRKIRLEL